MATATDRDTRRIDIQPLRGDVRAAEAYPP